MKTAILALAAFAIVCCEINVTGPEEHETQSVDVDKTEMARV